VKLLGSETILGATENWWLHLGEDGREKITVETVVDVEPYLKRTKAQYASATTDFKGELHAMAEIPTVVLQEWAKVKGLKFWDMMNPRNEKGASALNELLNAPEFRAFRLKPGRVDVRRGIR